MRQPKSVTIRDVARASGVTPMTVSNVINGKASEVSIKTRARVLREIQRLGYRRNANARGLRTRRRAAIGMLVLDTAYRYLRDPFITNLIAGLSNFATEHALSLVLQGIRPSEFCKSPLLNQIETDGVCAMLSGSARERAAAVALLRELRQPLVLFQEHGAAKADDVCIVRQDDFAGGLAVGRQLIDRKRVIMLVPSAEWPAMTERKRGVASSLAKRAHSAKLRIVRCGDESFDMTQSALAEAIRLHGMPDAIVGGNDEMAIAAIKFLQGRGVRVPQDVKVTGFNGFESWRYTAPELTTVLSPAYDMGWRGGTEILERLERGAFSSNDLVLPVRFSLGASA
jgi:LacI family transcriptional regulator